MKNMMGSLVALSASIMVAHASDIMMSRVSNGVFIAEGMIPGSTCTVEWASSPEQPFTNANDTIIFNDRVADSNGQVRLAIPMFFRVRGSTPVVPILIPAGTNSGTNPLDEGEWYDQYYPETYSLAVTNAFYMDTTEVTKAQWDAVYTWAVAHGYDFENAGLGKAPNHPVHSVNWFDCVKWCNARSEKEGRTPCYTMNGNTYKTGEPSAWVINSPECNMSVDGYRLPTSEEWEYAARGGLNSKRFPWGDTITHSQANYFSDGVLGPVSPSYDVSPTDGFHPTYYDDDENLLPYTMPVGAFAPNGYGLYDMSGNVWEWCNTSWFLTRSRRGGGLYGTATDSRCGIETWEDPYGAFDSAGFRAVWR